MVMKKILERQHWKSKPDRLNRVTIYEISKVKTFNYFSTGL